MRKSLDQVYLWSGYAAAVSLLCIAMTVFAQILGRFVGLALDSTETAGFFLAGATYLGLAHTFKSGDHIRVTLLTRLTHGWLSKCLNLWAIGVAAVAMMYFNYWVFDLVYFSVKFNDISPGLLAIPFWIPRTVMLLGLTVFTIALIDEFFRVLRGEDPTFSQDKAPPPEKIASA